MTVHALHPPAQPRHLTCIRCGHLVAVYELPRPWLEADGFVCGACLEPPRERLRVAG